MIMYYLSSIIIKNKADQDDQPERSMYVHPDYRAFLISDITSVTPAIRPTIPTIAGPAPEAAELRTATALSARVEKSMISPFC